MIFISLEKLKNIRCYLKRIAAIHNFNKTDKCHSFKNRIGFTLFL